MNIWRQRKSLRFLINSFPITFQDTATIDYNFGDFGGVVAMIVVDPTDANNLVGQAIKSDVAETWGGTVVGGNGLANPIGFSETETQMTVRVWSPAANTPVLLKVENAADPSIFVETLATTTEAETWETLTFDFATPEQGVLDFNNDYEKLVIFFNFGTSGAEAGEQTYYWDDMNFLSDSGVETFDFEERGIKVAPNPASDYIRIELEDNLQVNRVLQIFNVNGQMIDRVILGSTINTINTQNLVDGMYYLRINMDDHMLIQKLMIAK